MTPYARSILKFLSITYILGTVAGFYPLYINLPIPRPVYWIAIGLLLVGSVAYAYYNALGELRDVAGFYRPVVHLKRDTKNTFEELGVKTYLDYYRVRPNDDAIRSTLKEKGGVLVTGKPLSGKTRAAIEAIVATQPDAFLLKFDPKSFTHETISKLVIPCPLVFIRKPEVVLFFDNLDTLDPVLVDKLINRLADQTLSTYVVSTCDSGPKELRTQSFQQGTRAYFFESVDLGVLSEEISNEIFAEVWKGKGWPLLADLSLPGYIVSGSNPVLGEVRKLSREDKKVIQALRLAAGCGVVECEEKLFWGILNDVLELQPQDRSALLAPFIERGMILVKNPRGSVKRVLIQHTSYLDEAYDDLSQFKRDLARLADWLFNQGEAPRLAALGSHYWNVLFDSSSARKVYERIAQLKVPESSYLVTLASLYAELGELDLETETLDKALALSSGPVEQAQALISHGDALLYRLARPADAIGCYNRAYYLIEHSGDQKTFELIVRRSGDNLLVNRQYAEAERYFREWQMFTKDDDLLDASERLTLSLVGQGKNDEAEKTLRELWRSLPGDKRTQRAIQLLDNSEGCLFDEDPVKAIAQLAFDCFVGSAEAGSDLKTRRDEIVVFAYEVLSAGFLLPSELAHTYLTVSSELKLDRENQSAVWINLGLTRYLFGQVATAREAFEKARSIASDAPKIEMLMAGAEAGLGDCSLLVNDIKGASAHYQQALRLGKKSEDANMVNWANLGLGEVALAQNDYDEAEEHLLKLDRIINSYQQYVRIWLGMARVRIGLAQWEEAESFLTRGLSLRRRRDFAARRQEFQKLYDNLPKQRQEEFS